MIPRAMLSAVLEHLRQFPAVALLGPRQAGKTTLALAVAEKRDAVYLDLESDEDRAKLADPGLYLQRHENRLVILDEVHRVPGLFQSLRGLIDQGRRTGRGAGRFLLLGSASMDLMRQSGESLAGRIAYLELAPLDAREVGPDLDRLWVRGGFPESYLADDEAQSLRWRRNFLRTYLERDIPLLGPRIPAETLRRLWTMLAHGQGGMLNAAQLARGLGVTGKTVASYLDLLVDLLLVRRLPAWHRNAGKRLVKSPKVSVRDSGLTHALLGIQDFEALAGHPVAGPSWEAMVVENCLAAFPEGVAASFYRTAAGAEIDLILEPPRGGLWAIEVKRGLAPRLEKGFHQGRADLNPDRCFVVYPGRERYPLAEGVEAIGLQEMLRLLGDPDLTA